MNRRADLPVLALLALLTCVCGCCEEPVNVDKDKIELLEVHLSDINAHKSLDAEGLLRTIGPDLRMVRAGEVTIPTRDELKQKFTAYFEGARYDVYEDLQVPHAEVSDDGTMGWVISRMRVLRVEPDSSTTEFVYAGIMTYNKVRGRWQKTANVSTFAP